MSMHDSDARPYDDDTTVAEDVVELRRLSTVAESARGALEDAEDALTEHLTEVAERLQATEFTRNIEFLYSHPDMSYAEVLVEAALTDPSDDNVEALADEMEMQGDAWVRQQRDYDDYDDYEDDRSDEERSTALVVPRNPFWRLESMSPWGQKTITFNNGPHACVGCGNPDARPRTIVPLHLLGDPALVARDNAQPLCESCAERWIDMPTDTHLLAAALLTRGRPLVHVPVPVRAWLTRSELYDRDGGACRLCDFNHPSPEAFQVGHVLSQWDGYKRHDGWALPRPLVDNPLNVVLLCPTCNGLIGPASPPLRVGLRFLLKPWTGDPAGEAFVAARKRPPLPAFTTTERLR